MSRGLQLFNLVGVVALAILCVFQWQRDRALNLEVNRLEQVRIDNEGKLSEQAKTLAGLNSDLALFKDQVTTARTELSELRDKFRIAETENVQLVAERDQLRESLTNWMQAVTLRDERLKEANAHIQDLGDRLNDSIRKYNELATNYNSVVTNLNTLRAAEGS